MKKQLLATTLVLAAILIESLGMASSAAAQMSDSKARALLRRGASTQVVRQMKDLCNPDVLATMDLVGGLCSGMSIKLTPGLMQASIISQMKLNQLSGVIPSNLAAAFTANFDQCAKSNGALGALFQMPIDVGNAVGNVTALLDNAANCATNSLSNLFNFQFSLGSLNSFKQCIGSFSQISNQIQQYMNSIQNVAGSAVAAFSRYVNEFQTKIGTAAAQCLPDVSGWPDPKPDPAMLAAAMGLAGGTQSAFKTLKGLTGKTLTVSGIVNDTMACVGQAAGQIQPLANLAQVLSQARNLITGVPALLSQLSNLGSLFRVNLCPEGLRASYRTSLKNACAKVARLSRVRGVTVGAPAPFGWNIPQANDLAPIIPEQNYADY